MKEAEIYVAKARRRPWRGRVVGIVAASMLLMMGVATGANASSYPVHVGSTSVSLRDCYHPAKQPYPKQTCTFQATLPAGLNMTLICQHDGQDISGDPVWDYVSTPYGYGYVSDYYVSTGYSSWVPGVNYCQY
ncbi:hypothetical protein [Amycolatopsis sp. H20-H5]|uniref:hypothetical protein n=1 Tax=Amycolatopsis sp. H20-H5 TaxID=3046309 RepID=UPI002DBF70F7|nr:hypothetical protein [Amycolatopsis sp. H20-H5]MEC3978183.1 hypothetical protein [Amycolatopsis sp. H20-H5]